MATSPDRAATMAPMGVWISVTMGDMRGAGWPARDRELAAVGRLLDEPRGLLIEGGAGDRVCTAAMELAGDREYLVLATRAARVRRACPSRA